MPTTTPAAVSGSSVAAVTARAIPKSATTALPAENMMFSGFMSRCTTPRLWAYPSASATSLAMRTASTIDS